jgi:GAF domain-containing protein
MRLQPITEAHMDLDWLKKRINDASDPHTALRDASGEVCKAFNADRMTVYRVTEDGGALAAVVQTDLEDYGAIKVRVDSRRSLAGYVGASRRVVNIADAYDDRELAPLNMQRKMFMAVDERTGYRTRQVLAAPVVASGDGKLVGVVELLNRLDRQRFPEACEKDIVALCETLAPALEKP